MDDSATAAVCDAILGRIRTQDPTQEFSPAPSSDLGPEFVALREVYDARIADLQEQIRNLRFQLDGARDELREAHLAAIDHARALPEARKEARAEGAKEEHDRIRAMGVWARLTGRF